MTWAARRQGWCLRHSVWTVGPWAVRRGAFAPHAGRVCHCCRVRSELWQNEKERGAGGGGSGQCYDAFFCEHQRFQLWLKL